VVLLGKGLSEDLRNYLKYHIDLEIMETDGFNWRFTSLYGEPRKNKRFLTWKLLIFLLHHWKSLSWSVVGISVSSFWAREGGRKSKKTNILDNFK
jgi:hypothetical protein